MISCNNFSFWLITIALEHKTSLKMRQEKCWRMYYCNLLSKFHIFWESHKICFDITSKIIGFFFKLLWPSRNIWTLWIRNKPEAFLVISVDCFKQVHKLEHTISFGEIGEFLKMLLDQLPNWFWFDSFQHNFWQEFVKSNFFFKVFNVGFFVQCVL